MPATLANGERLHHLARNLFGPEPTGAAGLAEVLRCELFARGVASGRSLCERVQVLLWPLGSVEVACIRTILDDLADSGDATAGPGGLFAVAPLRVVRLAADRFALHGTIPTNRLRPELPGMELEEGLTRRVRLARGQELAFAEAAGRMGGLVLSPQRWAGLDRAPGAGTEWLAELDDRLADGGVDPESPGQGQNSPWQAYRPEAGVSPRQRWRTWGEKDPPARLWRTEAQYGWWWYAWTAGVIPATARFLRLSRDEACRTQFALDKLAGTSLLIPARPGEELVEIEVDAFLPLAEYRYLTTTGERCEGKGPVRYRVPTDIWSEVAATIRDRLGVAFLPEQPPPWFRSTV